MTKIKVIHLDGQRTPKKEIPSILIWFFICVQFIFGLNFGFNKSLKKNMQFLANCFCCFLSISLIALILTRMVTIAENQYQESISLICNSSQYVLHIFFLYFSKYNLYDFIVNIIYSVHTNLNWNKNRSKSIVILITIFFLTLYVVKCFICYFMCINRNICTGNYTMVYLHCILFNGMDVITMVQLLIYFYIYHSAKFLKDYLEDKDIKWVRKQFTAVADICDKISPTYGRLVSTYFSFMSFTYYTNYISLFRA